MTRGEFAEAVYEYCAQTGGSITSWIRSPKRNKSVGGVSHSPHMFGVGADVVYDDGVSSREDAVERAKALGLKAIREGDHDHLQPLDWVAG